MDDGTGPDEVGNGRGKSAAPRIAVLGVGNTLMTDDGLGAAVIRLLAERNLPKHVTLVADETAGMRLVRHFRESDVVFFVDAISTEAKPGAVFRFAPEDAGIDKLRANNIHGMGLSYLLAAARFTGADPEVVVYAVQVGDIRPNLDDELTEPVREAAKFVADGIAGEIASRMGSRLEIGNSGRTP